MYIILIYDIVLDEKGAYVLRKVFKICKKYMSHIQKSVFEGKLSVSQLEKMKKELGKVIRKEIDSVIIFKSNNDKWLEKEMWGIKDDRTSNFL